MSARIYLPSLQFSLMAISVAVAGGLIVAAKYTTRAPISVIESVESPNKIQDVGAWQDTLKAVQADSGVELPPTPDPDTVEALRQGAQTNNLTDSVSRTLIVNLTNAKAQGLGDDIPTQNQLIASAVGQIDQSVQVQSYTKNDLTVVPDSVSAKHAYGNALALVFAQNQHNSYAETMIVMDNATAQNSTDELDKLQSIALNYKKTTAALLQIPVPQTLTPFHLQLVNNFQKITGTYGYMETILTDPIRGLTAVKNYQSLTQETLRVFINIAQTLGKDGILFTKDEPGNAWGILLSTQQ